MKPELWQIIEYLESTLEILGNAFHEASADAEEVS